MSMRTEKPMIRPACGGGGSSRFGMRGTVEWSGGGM